MRASNWPVGLGSVAFLLTLPAFATANTESPLLEEVVVTAQRRVASLQKTPVSVAVMSKDQIESQGITSLGSLVGAVIPSLNVQPNGTSPSNLCLSIRGNCTADPTEVTREGYVAVYRDGVYVGRSQSLGMELTDIERIEVLRGPQGTMFGRNAINGAINIVSQKPRGDWRIKQSLSNGTWDSLRSNTYLDFPELLEVKTKITYTNSRRDGWVDNLAAGEADYGEYNKEAGRIHLNWESERLELDYNYHWSDVEVTQNYLQFYQDNGGLFGDERDRRDKTRLPLTLTPAKMVIDGHTLNVDFEISDNIAFVSTTAYGELDDRLNNNFGGVLYFNGVNNFIETTQDQISQEFNLSGISENWDWISGLYYYKEHADQFLQNFFTLDLFGTITGTPLSRIIPATTFDALLLQDISPARYVDASAESIAAYGQVTWTPQWSGRLSLSAGVRYTHDSREAARFETGWETTRTESDQVDFSFITGLQWTEDVYTYARLASGHKAGGVNTRSSSFRPFSEEEALSFEIGFRSEWMNRRLRLNLTGHSTRYKDMQLEFSDPIIFTIVETINAKRDIDISGLELDLTVALSENLTVGLNYSHLTTDVPIQPNPLANGEFTKFFIPQAPKHAGSVTFDYTFDPLPIGTLAAHLDVSSTDHFAHVNFSDTRPDSYILFNARLSLAEIEVGRNAGTLTLSVWGKNLTDEEYVVYAFPVGDPPISVIQAFGEPRSGGVDIMYEFR